MKIVKDARKFAASLLEEAARELRKDDNDAAVKMTPDGLVGTITIGDKAYKLATDGRIAPELSAPDLLIADEAHKLSRNQAPAASPAICGCSSCKMSALVAKLMGVKIPTLTDEEVALVTPYLQAHADKEWSGLDSETRAKIERDLADQGESTTSRTTCWIATTIRSIASARETGDPVGDQLLAAARKGDAAGFSQVLLEKVRTQETVRQLAKKQAFAKSADVMN